MISAAANAPSRAQSGSALSLDEPGQKAGGEEIAGAGRIDHFLDRKRIHRMGFVARDDDRALFRSRHDGKNIFRAQKAERRVEIACLIERMQFAFIGEENVDLAGRG